MPDIYTDMQDIDNTTSLLDANKVTKFAYTDGAFENNVLEWKGVYDYNYSNNIPDKPEMNPVTQENGLGGTSGVLPRSFMNHYFGRISYNLNKAVQALKKLLSGTLDDYAANISEYSENVKYQTGDVCFRVTASGGVKSITFYRCIRSYTGEPPWAWASSVSNWEVPEEKATHIRPVIGLPLPWHASVPDWAIRFDDGRSYTWTQVPALNFTEFRNTLLSLEDFGASADDDGFTVPDFSGRTPMFTGDDVAGYDNEVLTQYTSSNTEACVDTAHVHSGAFVSVASYTSWQHDHISPTCGSAGAHEHKIATAVQDYLYLDNDHRMPADTLGGSEFSVGSKMTDYTHSHTAYSGDGKVEDHSHGLSVTSGRTGIVPNGNNMGNPDSYTGCWIVRYK